MEQDLIEVRECCEEKDAFPFYNIVEQKVLLYEVIAGCLIKIGFKYDN